MSKNRGTVLFVDDENHILRSIKRGLAFEEFDMLFASSGREALQKLENHDVSVIVTDLRMPEMNGLELLKLVKEQHPDIIRIVLTAYSQISTIIAAINNGQIYQYIRKPWKLEEEFIPNIRRAINYYFIAQEHKNMVAKLKEQNEKLILSNNEITKLKEKEERSNKINSQLFSQIRNELLPLLKDLIGLFTNIQKKKKIDDLHKLKILKDRINTVYRHIEQANRWL